MHRTLRVISVAIPTLVAIVLATYYDRLPERMAVHWNYAGVADQFWPKSIPLVFTHILTAWGVLLVLHLYVPTIPKMSNLDRKLVQNALTGLSLSSSLLFTLMAASPLIKVLFPGFDLSWVIWLLAGLTLATVASLVLKVYAMPEYAIRDHVVR